jgi:hypothetical protein
VQQEEVRHAIYIGRRRSRGTDRGLKLERSYLVIVFIQCVVLSFCHCRLLTTNLSSDGR